MAIIRNVSLKKEHEEWLISQDIGISKYVQDKIEEDMAFEKLKKTKKNGK